MHGPNTEPAVLIEIQELRHKHHTSSRFVRPPGGRDKSLDYDFLMNTVSAALMRLKAIEDDNKMRRPRQIALNVWLGVISALVIVSIAIQLATINRLFGV